MKSKSPPTRSSPRSKSTEKMPATVTPTKAKPPPVVTTAPSPVAAATARSFAARTLSNKDNNNDSYLTAHSLSNTGGDFDDDDLVTKKPAAKKKKTGNNTTKRSQFVSGFISSTALNAFLKLLEQRTVALANYQSTCNARLSSSKEEESDEDSISLDIGPIFNLLVAKSTPLRDAVQGLTNFTIAEFCTLWYKVQHIVMSNCFQGLGNRSLVHPMDCFLVTLAQLKLGGSYKQTCAVFGISKGIFCRVVDGVISKCNKDLYEMFIDAPSMQVYCNRGNEFKNFPNALEAIDVTFQKTYKRGSLHKQKRSLYSGKHKQFGLKTEVAVGPDGRARFVSKLYHGSIHDMKMFKAHKDEHVARLTKDKVDLRDSDDGTIDDPGEGFMWAALMDKGYQGARQYGRFLTPKKRTARCDLDDDDNRRNAKLQEDRVLVENYFGRLKTLWGMMEKCYAQSLDSYLDFMFVAASLTNYQIGLLPLCNTNANAEQNYKQRLLDVHAKASLKRAKKQRKRHHIKKARRNMSNNTRMTAGDLEGYLENSDNSNNNANNNGIII